MDNVFNLPASDEFDYSSYKIPKVNNNILVLSDIHIPYHSISALTCAIKYGKEHDVNTILLNGDIIDCYMLSKFNKDPRKRSIKYELDCTRQFLDILDKEFPKAKKIYKKGNHCSRWENYMKSKAPELFDCEEFTLEFHLKLNERKIDYVKDERIIYAGKLPIIHGHEFGNKSGGTVNPARTALLKAKKSVMVSHSHVTSEDCKNSIDGEMITAWSTGALCELNPEYSRINDWNHGFAHITTDNNGRFYVNNKRIIKGKLM